jgi:hypothetical protein
MSSLIFRLSPLRQLTATVRAETREWRNFGLFGFDLVGFFYWHSRKQSAKKSTRDTPEAFSLDRSHGGSSGGRSPPIIVSRIWDGETITIPSLYYHGHPWKVSIKSLSRRIYPAVEGGLFGLLCCIGLGYDYEQGSQKLCF